ncbi:unnamed protein product [Owenia fusiformis]|uniref:TIR domain-containing protein n=1 Tax=Owenia fusiformis TaxID=6347 RepID=A0A8S4NNE0_OWEFU|nr:unnamed protein product [Owenia fusiformis]
MATGYQETDHLIVNMENGDQHEIVHELLDNLGDKQLPNGKEYHIFFSHSSVDKRWVLEMVRILEAPPYNLICCYDDRDFLPGRTSIYEINRAIISSMKTVLVFTPEAVKSRWCQTEVDTAITAAYDNLIDIIPVKLRPCVLPDTLKHINYLDVSHLDKNQATERILQAVAKDEKEPELPPQVQRNMVTNGSYFNIETKLQNCSSVLDTTVADMKMGLDVRGIALNDLETADIIDSINSSPLMRHACVLRVNATCLPDHFTIQCILIFTFILLDLFGSLILSLIFGILDSRLLFMVIIPIPLFTFVILPVIGLPLCNTLLKISFRNMLRKISIDSVVNKNVIFTVMYKNRNPVLAAMKYDIAMCLEYIVNEKINDNPELEIEAYKLKVMKQHLFDYAVSIQSGTQKATVVRHVVAYEQMCFCQFVQKQERQ